MGRGPAPHTIVKVERRPNVHVGVRDSIVHVDISRPRIGTVVRITTTQHQTEARTPNRRRDSLFGVQRYEISPDNQIKYGKKSKIAI